MVQIKMYCKMRRGTFELPRKLHLKFLFQFFLTPTCRMKIRADIYFHIYGGRRRKRSAQARQSWQLSALFLDMYFVVFVF